MQQTSDSEMVFGLKMSNLPNEAQVRSENVVKGSTERF